MKLPKYRFIDMKVFLENIEWPQIEFDWLEKRIERKKEQLENIREIFIDEFWSKIGKK